MIRVRQSLQVLAAVCVAATSCLQQIARGFSYREEAAPHCDLRHRSPK